MKKILDAVFTNVLDFMFEYALPLFIILGIPSIVLIIAMIEINQYHTKHNIEMYSGGVMIREWKNVEYITRSHGIIDITDDKGNSFSVSQNNLVITEIKK